MYLWSRNMFEASLQLVQRSWYLCQWSIRCSNAFYTTGCVRLYWREDDMSHTVFVPSVRSIYMYDSIPRIQRKYPCMMH